MVARLATFETSKFSYSKIQVSRILVYFKNSKLSFYQIKMFEKRSGYIIFIMPRKVKNKIAARIGAAKPQIRL